jgi:hypothetical protein
VLNVYFKTKMLILFRECGKLDRKLLQEKTKGDCWFNDYEIHIELLFFANKLLKGDPELVGHAIYEGGTILIFFKSTMGISERRDHMEREEYRYDCSDLPEGHPLNRFKHCKVFHWLYSYTHLSWQDILCIDEVWHEIHVKYQLIEEF